MKKPTNSCYACGATDFWQRTDGRWLCNICHPNSNPNPGSPPVVEEEYSPEVIALRDRVIRGNDVLFKAWLQIKGMDGEEREEQMERWLQANKKLRALCDTLELNGYCDCLYIANGKKTRSCLNEQGGWWCQVCPCIVALIKITEEKN